LVRHGTCSTTRVSLKVLQVRLERPQM
jgi:hypothetical protein